MKYFSKEDGVVYDERLGSTTLSEDEKKIDRFIAAIKLEAKQVFIDELIKATKLGD